VTGYFGACTLRIRARPTDDDDDDTLSGAFPIILKNYPEGLFGKIKSQKKSQRLQNLPRSWDKIPSLATRAIEHKIAIARSNSLALVDSLSHKQVA